jgi:hypothetical protein
LADVENYYIGSDQLTLDEMALSLNLMSTTKCYEEHNEKITEREASRIPLKR